MRHDWVAWLHERDAQVLLLSLMQAVEAPDATLETLRRLVADWRANAVRALEANDWTATVDKYLEVRVEALRAVRTSAPPPAAPAPLPPLRQKRAALWRIALLCKAALASPALPLEARPYFVQIAEVCREGVQRQEGDRGEHGT